jgi:RND superfamily putative drug exporter
MAFPVDGSLSREPATARVAMWSVRDRWPVVALWFAVVAFHSIVIPVKAILLNLLSTAAAYGALVLVFQDGWLAEPLGITPSGVIESWVPLFVFTVLFGLSMDYHLFILTRIKEARDRGADSHSAVATGIAATSGTITSAASIMVVVFAVFVTLKFVFLQQLGLGRRSPCSSMRR